MSNALDVSKVDPVSRHKRLAADILRLGRMMSATLDFNAAGIEWLETFVDQAGAQIREARHPELCDLLGSFYGECLIAELDGRWDHADGLPIVICPGHARVFPIQAIAARLDNAAPTLPLLIVPSIEAVADPRTPFAIRSTTPTGAIDSDAKSASVPTQAKLASDTQSRRHFIPTSGTADEIISNALEIVRRGDNLQVEILLDMSEISANELSAAFRTGWLSMVNDRHPHTTCRKTGRSIEHLTVWDGGQEITLVAAQRP